MSLTARQKDYYARLAAVEQKEREQYFLHLQLDTVTVLALTANLQLALRHPANNGPSAQTAARIIGQIIERLKDDGMIHNARLLELGQDPDNDE